MFNLRLWLTESWHRSKEQRASARIERLVLAGKFKESVQKYLIENQIHIDDLLKGISNDETREEIKTRYLGELRTSLRLRMRSRHLHGKVVGIELSRFMFLFGLDITTYIFLGGKLKELMAPNFTAETLCSIATGDVTARFIIPQLRKEKIRFSERDRKAFVQKTGK